MWLIKCSEACAVVYVNKIKSYILALLYPIHNIILDEHILCRYCTAIVLLQYTAAIILILFYFRYAHIIYLTTYSVRKL